MPAHDAEDVLAETFLVAWRRLDELPGDPLPWLIAVARRIIATRRRGAARRTNLHSKLQNEAPAGSSPSTERLEIAAAFATLKESDREILMLMAWDGLTAAQASEVIGCSKATFSLRLHRARKRLQSAFDAEVPPFHMSQSIPAREEAR